MDFFLKPTLVIFATNGNTPVNATEAKEGQTKVSNLNRSGDAWLGIHHRVEEPENGLLCYLI